MNPLRTLKRMVHNSDATVQGIANQSDLINQTVRLINSFAVEAEISSQSDLLGRKLDTLIKIMNELREVHKAQLTMQRSAAEAIKQSANPNS